MIKIENSVILLSNLKIECSSVTALVECAQNKGGG
jgi:hypothetical protein